MQTEGVPPINPVPAPPPAVEPIDAQASTQPVMQIKPDMNREKEILYVNVSDIIPNRFQPRLSFDEESLNDLADSIKQHGVIQPLVVRKLADKYEIIAGERRLKASTLAGLQALPVVLVHLSDIESAEVALIENIQRKDLTAIEEARSYQKILELGQMTQEQLASRMGKSQATIANKLRLLNLSGPVQEALLKNQISERHARSLLSIPDPIEQEKTLKDIIENRMTVRQTDELICSRIAPVQKPNINEGDSAMNPESQTPQVAQTAVPEPSVSAVPSVPVTPEIVPSAQTPSISIPETPLMDQASTVAPTMPEPLIIEPTPSSTPEPEAPVQEPMPNIDDLLRVDTAPPNPFDQGPSQAPEVISDLPPPTPARASEPPVSSGPVPTSNIPTLGSEHLANTFSDVPTPSVPVVEPVINNVMFDQEPDIPIDPNFIAAGDLRAAINSVRTTIKTIEKYGFKVETEESDLEKQYQITIKIDKPY